MAGGDPCDTICASRLKMQIIEPEDINCEKCKYSIPLMPGNIEVMGFIDSLSGSLLNQSGLNIDAIDLGFRIFDIPKFRQPEILEKLVVYSNTVHQHRTEEIKRKATAARLGAKKHGR